jgi:hypothetical protein
LSARAEWDTEGLVRWKTLFSGLLVVALAAPARAETGSSNAAAAEALFAEGRRLANAGNYTDACPKFEASQKLDPGLGTLLNLADCYEKIGKTASAWAEYREAIPLARAAGSSEREKLATDCSKALESRLSTLTIRAMGGDNGDAALDVRRDGVSVDSAQLGVAIPVDPGWHEVTASSSGQKPWSSKVQVGANGEKVVVEVPKLVPAEGSAAAALMAPPDQASGPKSSPQRPIAIAVGAVGVVGLGLGTFFGLSASSTWKDAKAACGDYPYECTQEGLDKQNSAQSKATISTVAFIAGGVALATGIVLFVTAGSGKQETAIGIGPGSIVARRSF